MRFFIVLMLILVSSIAVATDLMNAKEARQTVVEYNKSLLASAKADLNNRVVERVERAANTGESRAEVEILAGEQRFVAAIISLAAKLGYKVTRKNESLIIDWGKDEK